MRKYVFITGGTKGIGKAVAYCLAESGYNLILTYASDTNAAESVRDELQQKYGVEVDILKANSSDITSIDQISDFLSERSITLDSVVFNAGITCRDPFEDMKLNDWERVFFTNVHFPVFLLQRIVDKIKKGGSVVFTGSSMGMHPHSVSLAYGVSKSAVHALVENLVKFMSPYQIRVNGVAPGFVDTEWQKTKPVEIRRSIESKVALGRFCEPEELGDVYKLLIENKYINGEIVVVDGGYSYK